MSSESRRSWRCLRPCSSEFEGVHCSRVLEMKRLEVWKGLHDELHIELVLGVERGVYLEDPQTGEIRQEAFCEGCHCDMALQNQLS